ncbi:MAG: trigger factor, partial [Thiohalomonadales bacterium]
DREAQQGDRVTLDFEGKIDNEIFPGGQGEDMAVEIGAKRMIPGFEDKLIGIKVGEQRDIALNFPEDYHAADVAGKPVQFHLTAKKIEAPELPELNDDFAEALGVKEGGLSAFSAQVKTNMGREAKQSMMTTLKANVMDALLLNHDIEVPKVLVDNEIAALMKQRQDTLGQQESLELKADLFEEQARRRVTLGLILSEVVTKNELKVEPSVVRETIEAIAAGYDHPGEVIKYYYGDKQRLAEIENVALEQKIVDWVMAQSTVTEKTVAFSDLSGQK